MNYNIFSGSTIETTAHILLQSSHFNIDINECTSAVPGNQHDCDLLTSTCDNQPGSFECVCNDGFEANVDGDCVGKETVILYTFELHANIKFL